MSAIYFEMDPKKIKMDWQMNRGMDEYVIKFSKILVVNVGNR